MNTLNHKHHLDLSKINDNIINITRTPTQLAAQPQEKHLVVIDSRVEDYAHLAAGVIPHAQVLILPSHLDGIELISQALQASRNIASVHIISHGSPGCLQLGNNHLCLDTLSDYAIYLKNWFEQNYTSPPTLLLYGCNVAAGDAGAEFIAKLKQLTGAEIAASAHPTGNHNLGGDWNLEVTTAQASTTLALQPQVMASYSFVLPIGVDLLEAVFRNLEPDPVENFTSEGAFNQDDVLFDFNFRSGDENNLELSGFQAEGANYDPVSGIALDEVRVRRVDNDNDDDDSPITGVRELVWFEQLSFIEDSEPIDLNLKPSAISTMEEALLSNVINLGTDNTFTNQGNPQGNNNNVERVDFLATEGLTAPESNLDDLGFLVVERGGNDPLRIAAITAVDEEGNPTAFGSLINVDSGLWGESAFELVSAIARQDPDDNSLRYTFTREPQTLGGIFFSYEDLGIDSGETFFGYSVFPADITSENDLVGLSDFPTDTSEIGGGLDLIGSNLVFETTGGGDLDTTPVNSEQMKFTLTGVEALFVNEVGYYVVDDETGSVDGVAPGDEDYLEAVLGSSQVIFSGLSNTSELFGANPTRIIDGFVEGTQLGYYLVANSTTDQVLADLDAGQTPSADVFFSFPTANSDNLDHTEIINLGGDTFQIDWEDTPNGDFDLNDLDLVVSPLEVDEVIPLGNNLQGGEQQELIDLRSQAAQPLEAQISMEKNAVFNHTVGIYPILNESGSVADPISGEVIEPGEARYVEVAIAQSQVNGVQFESNAGSLTTNLNGGSLYASYLISNNTDTFFPFLGANGDFLDHVRLLGDNTFGWDDFLGGGDGDYNDVVFAIEFIA